MSAGTIHTRSRRGDEQQGVLNTMKFTAPDVAG